MGYGRSGKQRKGSRSTFWAAICSVLFLWVFIPQYAAAATGTVTASSANIRAGADIGSTAVASVRQNAELEVVEQVTGSDGKIWYKVIVDANTTGYVRSDLISVSGTVPTGSNTGTNNNTTTNNNTNTGNNNTVNTNVTVNTSGVTEVQPVGASVNGSQVRVRADSNTNSNIVTTLSQNTAVTVTGTKPGNGSDVWYLVNFTVGSKEVTGYIRSDFITLSGELLPPEEQTEDPADTPGDTPNEPDPPEVTAKMWDTVYEDGVWKLVNNDEGKTYPITDLIETSEKNADELIKAKKKISGQTTAIVILAIIMVVLLMGVTLLVFKIKDMMDEEGFEKFSLTKWSPGGGSQSRSSVNRPARPAGQRPGQGARPAGQSGTPGQRPASSGAQGQRPTGQRPASSGTPGQRPVSQGSPASGQPRPAGSTAQRPVSQGERSGNTAGNLEQQARNGVESRNLEKDAAEKTKRQSKNFMMDDDEFEFEFLNWDGEEEK